MSNRKYYISILSLILLNIVYFLWQPYNKHILPLFGDYSTIFDPITNVIYFALYYIVFIIIFNNCFAEKYSKNIIKGKTVFAATSIFIIILISLDLVKWALGKVFADYTIILYIFLSMLYFMIVIAVLFKLSKIKIKKENFNKIRFFTLAAVIFSVCILVLIFSQNENVKDIEYLRIKYDSSAYWMIAAENNFIFRGQITGFLIETIFDVLIFTLLYFEFGIKSTKIKITKREVCVFSLQLFLVVVAGIFVNVKYLYLPVSFLLKAAGPSTHHEYAADDDFHYNDMVSVILRRSSYTDIDMVYIYGEIEFIQNNLIFEKTAIKDDFFSTYDIYKRSQVDNQNSRVIKLEKNEINGFEFTTYGGMAILYLDNGIPCMVKSDEIFKQPKNEKLMTALEYLIENGNWTYFEYGAKYLLKYNKEFIIPYIERYANGTFFDWEVNLECNYGIKPQYIALVADTTIIKTG